MNALQPFGSGNVVKLRPNREIERHLAQIRKSKKSLEYVQKNIRKTLNIDIGKGHSLLARAIGCIIPKRFYQAMPVSMMKWLAEEADVLEQIAGLLRECINSNQEAAANLANCAIAETENLEEFVRDIKAAEAEKWDARRLQEYMAAEADIAMDPAIAQLLDDKFSLFSEQDKEARRRDLIEQLQSLALTRRKLIDTLRKTCDAGLSQLNSVIGQYYSYSRVYQPVAVIRNSAKDMLTTDNSLYAAREALMASIEVSMGAIEGIIKSASAVNEYQVSSAELHRLLDASNRRISVGLAELNKIESGRRKAILGEVVDAKDTTLRTN